MNGKVTPMHGMAEHSGSIQSIRPLRCKAIAPGAYKLFAWEDVETGAYKDPEFLKAFEALGERTTIQENSHESAELKLIPAKGKKSATAPAFPSTA